MPRSTLIVLVLVALVVVVLGGAVMAAGDASDTERRKASLQFAPEMPEKDRAWVRAAIAAARPEAQRLIDEVDGEILVEGRAMMPEAIGREMLASDGGAGIALDTGALNADRALDRNGVVRHELGHVIDHLLVDDELVQQLDAGIPRG